ncbi:glycosyltransferase family 4 protein [Flagellimonas onchidii]|uniref:glycosyltransferase family 4 protein n=1 Tax=Flagellimonas onchidii TaxID=2562684 RepID=UPI0010A5F2DD|nr:glycosyltransferase family 4 protein [Allomuricauda onchidii]
MTNKAKIAFVIPSLSSGGAERVVSTLSNSLCKDYEVHIICLIKTIPFYKIHDQVRVHYCIETQNNSSGLLTAVKNNILLVKKITRIAKNCNIDILLSFITSANVLSIISAKLSGIQVIVSERNNPEKDYIPKMWKLLRNGLFPFASLIVVQTEAIKDFYTKKMGEKKLVIIPNPISTDFSPPVVNASTQKSKENIVLTVGRLNSQKAQDVLIKAFASSKNGGWKLYLVGEGEERERLENLIDSYGLQQKVLLLGRVEKMQEVYEKAKIFAFSSIFEGFPNALIEAMYFGLACVSTNCPTGPSDLIDNGKNGYLVEVNDIVALTKRLNTLMEDEGLRMSLGEKAQQTVSNFNAVNITKEWSTQINQCLNIN